MPFIAGDVWSLFLTGNFGTGKSCFASAMFYWRMAHFVDPGATSCVLRGMWRDCDTLFTRTMKNFDHWNAISDQMQRTEFLVLDDLGSTRITPYVHDCLMEILMARHRNSKKTILTTNMTLPELAEQLDGRIESRLKEGVIIETGSTDLRNSHTERNE